VALPVVRHFLRGVRSFLTLFLAWTLTGCSTPAPRADAPPAADDFERQPALDERIEVTRFDRKLMAQAIFHETNRVRLELGLPVFRSLSKLDEAADREAAVGKVYQPPSHTNPFPMIGRHSSACSMSALKSDKWRKTSPCFPFTRPMQASA